MARLILSRLGYSALTLLSVLLIVFVALRLSGNPAHLLAPEGATPEQIAELGRQLGFDKPYIVQFATYLGGLLRFDLGQSVVQRLPVLDILWSRLPYSLALSGFAFFLAVTGGCALGLIAASSKSVWSQGLVFVIVLITQSLPTFLTGLLLILLFSVGLGWLPSSGAGTPASVLMPGLALGAYSMAIIARIVMTGLREELAKEYARACRARGLSEMRILFCHGLRNAAPTLLALIALEAGNLFAGTLVVETVFAWPGLGQLLLQSVQARDYPVAQAVVLVVALIYIAANLIADLAQMLFDPHLRSA